jgi:murein DD-endopeptidase MepM/ murein hydrolase activator NlpD
MRTSRGARRLAAGIALVGLLAFALPGPVAADDGLDQARRQLHRTKERIHDQLHALRDLQRQLNELATRISRNESLVAKAKERIPEVKAQMRPLQHRYLQLKARLDQRSRQAYIMGPGPEMLYLFTATSVQDAVERISFLNEMNRRDEVLAQAVADAHAELERHRSMLQRYADAREIALRELAVDRRELRRRLARSNLLLEKLRGVKDQILYEISKIRPFALCPVDGPHAVADDFGIWVHHPKNMGGDHIHMGNDIMAPYGTPIVAPFDGQAVATPNKIGGLAVKVYGQFGYVYNAHLSAYGTLGAVTKGTVIGYVGATGNAGGPHDHFEWHPGNGDAVDPNPFLMLVC